MTPVESVIVHGERHEITVACGGEDYLITEADFLASGIAESGEADLEKLAFYAEKLLCIKKASLYLSNGDLSGRRFAEKLAAKNQFNAEVITAVTALFTEKGYLDDLRLAERFTEELASKRRWGKIRIKSYLYQKGFKREDIAAAVENADESVFVENLSYLIEHGVSGGKYDIADKKSLSKLGNSLLHAGYSWDEIKPAISDYINNNQIENI